MLLILGLSQLHVQQAAWLDALIIAIIETVASHDRYDVGPNLLAI